jgi:hypothetical protein
MAQHEARAEQLSALIMIRVARAYVWR